MLPSFLISVVQNSTGQVVGWTVAGRSLYISLCVQPLPFSLHITPSCICLLFASALSPLVPLCPLYFKISQTFGLLWARGGAAGWMSTLAGHVMEVAGNCWASWLLYLACQLLVAIYSFTVYSFS